MHDRNLSKLSHPHGFALFAAGIIAVLLGMLVPVPCKAGAFPEPGLSPGPSGGLFDNDYRIPVAWLQNYGNGYGPGNYARMLPFGGQQRYYEVHVPPQYAAGQNLPLVIVLHGGGGNPDVVRYQSRMDEVSDKHGFIAAYPSGTGTHGYDRRLYWNTGPANKEPALRNIDDVAFISGVLDDLERFFSIDRRRVYATGISNGGQMSYRLAALLSNRITAVAPISGDRTIGQFFPAPPRPIPVIVFHGQEDTWLPFNGGSSPASSAFEAVQRIPVPETVDGWVVQAGGDPKVLTKSRTGGHAVLYRYPPQSANGVEVDFWVLEDGGHTWPGGNTTRVERMLGVGNVNHDIFASEMMWNFFERYKIP